VKSLRLVQETPRFKFSLAINVDELNDNPSGLDHSRENKTLAPSLAPVAFVPLHSRELLRKSKKPKELPLSLDVRFP